MRSFFCAKLGWMVKNLKKMNETVGHSLGQKKRPEEQVHTIAPVYNKESRILILGSFPSVKSREEGFFYGHPQNRFWKVLARVFQTEVPATIPEKRTFLLEHRVAVWDVIGQCEITGSSDSSIRNVVPNPIQEILDATKVEQIFVNGKKAEQLYKRYIYPETKRNALCLPSTSPANASWNLEKLTEAWKIILG